MGLSFMCSDVLIRTQGRHLECSSDLDFFSICRTEVTPKEETIISNSFQFTFSPTALLRLLNVRSQGSDKVWGCGQPSLGMRGVGFPKSPHRALILNAVWY